MAKLFFGTRTSPPLPTCVATSDWLRKRRIQQQLVEFVKPQAATESAERDALWQQTAVTIQ